MFYDVFRNEPNLHHVTAGDYLFKKGAPTDVMYVLISGSAQVLVEDRIVEEVEPGGILGAMSLVDHRQHSADVLATTDCEFACTTQKHFHFLVSQTPNFATEIMRTMANRLLQTNARIG